jgi:hypothetical protein
MDRKKLVGVVEKLNKAKLIDPISIKMKEVDLKEAFMSGVEEILDKGLKEEKKIPEEVALAYNELTEEDENSEVSEEAAEEDVAEKPATKKAAEKPATKKAAEKPATKKAAEKPATKKAEGETMDVWGFRIGSASHRSAELIMAKESVESSAKKIMKEFGKTESVAKGRVKKIIWALGKRGVKIPK